MKRGCGAIPDVRDRIYPHASDVVGTTLAPPRASDGCRAFCPVRPVDQGSDESCVGEALAQALFARMGVDGLAQVMPSSRAIWYFARKRAGFENANSGCRPFDAIEAIAENGYPDEALWPRTKHYSRRPDQLAMRGAFDRERLVVGRIQTEGADREDELRSYLHPGVPVTLALTVDEAYQESSSGVWTPGGRPRGRHYVLAHSYDAEGVYTLGSYGPDWAKDGHIQVPWSVMRNPSMAGDLWAIRFSGR
jgi:hypothetical protein